MRITNNFGVNYVRYLEHKFLIFIGGIVSFFTGLIFLLVIEYRYFCVQSTKMIALQEDYRNYVVAVKKILSEYNRVTDRLKILESIENNEKKKLILV